MITNPVRDYNEVVSQGAVVGVPRAVPVVLTASVRARLKQRVRGRKTPYRDRQRALIVLLAARGWPNARIARQVRVGQDMVRTWRGRFAKHGLDGLADRPRSGRPRRISELDRAQVCALACQLPAETGVPLARWSAPELAGEPLGPDDRILCVDAKPSIQARARCHPSAPPEPGQVMRIEHEYERMGALALLAALDVHTGDVFASTPPTTGITPFMTLIDQIMTQDRYRSACRVFVIVDNGSDHRGQTAIKRLRDRYPNSIMIHTPVHASWLNQAEIFFSIIQRKVVTPNNFASIEQLTDTLLAFITRYNTTATPFKWKYTATDLERHLARTPTPAPATPTRQPQPQAA